MSLKSLVLKVFRFVSKNRGDKIMPTEVIKEKNKVFIRRVNDNRYIIVREEPIFYSSKNYLGNGRWGNSRAIEFLSEKNARNSFNKALCSHSIELFAHTKIRFCRQDSTDNIIRWYGVVFLDNVGSYLLGAKCNHIKWSLGSSVIKVCDEDDTVIENIVFGE